VLFDAAGRTCILHVEGVGARSYSSAGRLVLERTRSLLVVSGTHARTLFATATPMAGVAWSPDGLWLLTALPAADQWVFGQAGGMHRVLAVSHIGKEFGGRPSLDGWIGAAA